MTTNMSKVSSAFANDDNVVILSHTVTPERDSVSVLKKYALTKSISNKNWHLLTGNKQDIYRIARKGYFADESLGYNKDTSEFLHTENFILVDKHGRIRGVYNGTIELEVDQLIQHIKLLKEEE
jgi:protein SCO1